MADPSSGNDLAVCSVDAPAGGTTAFVLQSDSFEDGDYLGEEFVLSSDFGFGCAGGNQSPELNWSGAPEGTKSYTITCFDPDAPTPCGCWHWVVVNIPPEVSVLAVGAGDGSGIPGTAVQTRTDFGTPGWSGPCPRQGDHPHRYIFTVYAVGDPALATDADTMPAMISEQLDYNSLATATLMGLYKH